MLCVSLYLLIWSREPRNIISVSFMINTPKSGYFCNPLLSREKKYFAGGSPPRQTEERASGNLSGFWRQEQIQNLQCRWSRALQGQGGHRLLHSKFSGSQPTFWSRNLRPRRKWADSFVQTPQVYIMLLSLLSSSPRGLFSPGKSYWNRRTGVVSFCYGIEFY